MSKRLLLSLVIFAVVMLIFALPYVDWGFVNEDHAFIVWSKLRNLHDVIRLFGPHDIGWAFAQPTSSINAPTFFSVLYRPMQFVLFGLETALVGVAPYHLLLVVIALHACVSVAMFNIFLYFFDGSLAFLGALFFALHPTLAHWVGVFTCQIYIVDLLYLLIIILLLKKYIDSGRFGYYVLSCFMSLLCIFAKETLIVLPAWVVAAVFVYRGLLTQTFYALENVWYGVRVSIGYWCVSALYLFVRALLFPMTKKSSSLGFNLTFSSFIDRQKERVGDWISYICDFIYVGIVPSGNRFVKGLLVLMLGALLLWPFIADKEKRKYLVFLVLSMLFFTWPAVLLYYQPRYLYIALPFFFFIILIALNFYMSRFVRYKKMMIGCLTVLLVINASAFMWKQKQKEKMLRTITAAFRELAHDPAVSNRGIYFVGLPWLWFGAGNAQAIWFYKPEQKQFPIMYNTSYFAFKSEPFYELKEHDVQVTLIDGGVRMTSHDGENLWFPGCSSATMRNSATVHQKNSQGQPSDVTIMFPESIRVMALVFVTWDYIHQKFKIV